MSFRRGDPIQSFMKRDLHQKSIINHSTSLARAVQRLQIIEWKIMMLN